MTPSPAISRSLAPDLSFNRRRDYVKLTEVAESLLAGALSMIAESTRLSLAFTAYKSAHTGCPIISANFSDIEFDIDSPLRLWLIN